MQQRKWTQLVLAILLIATINNFALAQREKKTAYAVLLDNTLSMRKQFSVVIGLGKTVVKETHQRGPVAIFNFASQGVNKSALVTTGIEWSEDENALENYIDGLYLQGGQTTLLDAIYKMAETLDAKADSQKDAFAGKTIILITDGEDRSSKVKSAELVKKLQADGIKVYAIGLIRDLDNEGGFTRESQRQIAEGFLRTITKKTGGRVLFPDSIPRRTDELVSSLLAQ